MKTRATLLGCGICDDLGVAGTRPVGGTWQELGASPPGTGRTVRTLFGREDATFRRIDMPAKALVMACGAAGLDQVLPEHVREQTAICIETDVGSLVTDLAFAESLGDECVHAGIFPYSLTSTCLGEIALRYGLRGPTVSMSVRRGISVPGAALRESLRMLHCGDVPAVLTGAVDALDAPARGHTPGFRAVVAVLTRDGDGIDTIDWPDPSEDPLAAIAARCR